MGQFFFFVILLLGGSTVFGSVKIVNEKNEYLEKD